MNTPSRFVLHHSVAALWWLWHQPYAREATQFLERLAADEVTVLAPADMEFTVLSDLAADLGPVHFDPGLSGMLFHDVRTHFRLMESRGWLTAVSRERLAPTAFVIACFHAIG